MKNSILIDQEFIQILKKYERMIYYLINKLNIHDRDGDFFQEGVIALWEAYRKYYGKDYFSKMAYITINSRLIDLIRKRSRIIEREALAEFIKEDTSPDPTIENFDPHFWQIIKDKLTDKQWIYVQKRILNGMSYKEIAFEEKTTVDAVKGWGKEVKRKLKPVLKDYLI